MAPSRSNPDRPFGLAAPFAGGRRLPQVGCVFFLSLLVACRPDPTAPDKPSAGNSPISAPVASPPSDAVLQETTSLVTTTAVTNANLRASVVDTTPRPFPYEKLIEFAMAERGAYFMSGRVFRFTSDRKAIVDLSESFDNAIADLAQRQLRYYARMEAANRLRNRSKRYGPSAIQPPRPPPTTEHSGAGFEARLDARLEEALLLLSTEVLDSSIGEDLDDFLQREARMPHKPDAISVQLKSPLAALGSMVVVNTSDRDLTDCVLITTAVRDAQAVADALDHPTTRIHHWLDEIGSGQDLRSLELPIGSVETLRSAVDRRSRFFVESFPAGATFIAKALPATELPSCTEFHVSLYSRELYVRNIVAPDLAAAQAAQISPRRPSP